jgi:hypothetical protein
MVQSQICLNLHKDDYHFFPILINMIPILAKNKKS